MAVLTAAPPYWLSALAERCLELLDKGQWVEMQELVRVSAPEHGTDPTRLAVAVSHEWDRIGFTTGDRRKLIL